MALPKIEQRNWRDLVRQANEETDPQKMLDLLQQVIEMYYEEKRRARRS